MATTIGAKTETKPHGTEKEVIRTSSTKTPDSGRNKAQIMAEETEAEREQRRERALEGGKQLLEEAEIEKRVQVHVEDGWKHLCTALGVDPRKMRRASKKSILRGMVKIAYMLVLAGCELDLYGFAMAFPGYWELEHGFMKILLILGPVGYSVATGMYMVYNTPYIHKKWAELWETDPPKPKVTIRGIDKKDEEDRPQTPSDRRLDRSITAPPIELKYYHFLPIFRYYCVLKEKTADDIEAIFRVNSLSSFSLGIAQLCGIVLQGVETNWNMDIFTWINVGSQVVNWSITIMYFLTPISSKMSASIKIDGLIDASRARLRKKFETWKNIISDDKRSEEEKKIKRDKFIKSIDEEICALTNKNPPLKDFSMEMKFEALISLHIIQNTVYAAI